MFLCAQMFARKTKDIVQTLGAQDNILYHDNLNEKVELLSLVKIHKKTVKREMKYTFFDLTMFQLLDEGLETPGT